MRSAAVKKVGVTDLFRDTITKSTALVADTSTTLATVLGVAIPTDARGVVLNITGTGDVHYNPVGAATTGNAIIPTQYTINGNKTELDAVRLIGSSGTTPTVNIILFEE